MRFKILYTIYFFFWTMVILSVYASLIDELYYPGRIYGLLFGILAILFALIIGLTEALSYPLKSGKQSHTKKSDLIILIPWLLLVPFALVSLIPNRLEEKWHTIEVSYVAWGCECANWSLGVEDNKVLEGDRMNTEYIFIEPASDAVSLPDSINFNGSSVRLKGQFYKNKGFPKGYQSEQQPEKARVFRYTKFEIR